MSKTFASRINRGTEVYLGDGIGSTTLHLMIRDVGATVGKAGIYLPASDAPALALAILEAAGVTPFTHDNPVIYNGSWLESIAADLKELIAHQERATAEAKDKAKLEAEALKLLLAFQDIDDPDNRGCEWHQYGTNTKDKWLAVARKAREMRAEK